MDSPPKRPTAVTAAAVVAISGSVLLLLGCSITFFVMLLVKLPGTAAEASPVVRGFALATQGFMICLALFGVATGFGIIYLRNWSRISILIWSGLSVFFGAIGIPLGYLMQFPPNANAPALPAESMQAVRWVLLLIYGIPLLIGIWWLILFNRKTVKAQFEGTPVSAEAGLPRKLACPLPVAVLAWFYIASVLNLFFLPLVSFHVPLFVFGRVLQGRASVTALVLSSLVFAIAGIGLLKLKPWSYSLTMGLQIFWLISSIVSMLTPNYGAVMDSYLNEMQASLHLPETQFPSASFTHQYIWTLVAGLQFAGTILGFLVYYRPRFLEAASRAASAS